MVEDKFLLSCRIGGSAMLACFGAATLTACSDTSDIQDAVRESLIDPESARFGKVIKYSDKDGSELACVEVNAKNRMGGYVGDDLFLAMKTEGGEWKAMSLDLRNMGVGSTSCEWFVQNIGGKS